MLETGKAKPSCTHFCKSLCSKERKCIAKSFKKVIPSRTLISTGDDRKSCSTGKISHSDQQSNVKPKKTTKSDLTFNKKGEQNSNKFDFCTECGDNTSKKISSEDTEDKIHIAFNTTKSKSITSRRIPKNVSNNRKCTDTLKQYYKNDNFHKSSESFQAKEISERKPPLGTIKEVSDAQITSDTKSFNSIVEIYPESSAEEAGFYDLDKQENIEEIKKFRKKNYFECHSAKSRIKTKSSEKGLGEHKCFYRFYLNERLFPVPLNTDHHNTIRCIQCHLPLEDAKMGSNNSNDRINGTIQAKVRLNNEVQDMILMLPTKEPLIIKEKRKELKNPENQEVVYFGIIKLNSNGDSIFNTTNPDDSLALKFQKGYKEFENSYCYNYEAVNKDDVIII